MDLALYKINILLLFAMSVIDKFTEFLSTLKYELRYKCWTNTVVMILSVPHCLY